MFSVVFEVEFGIVRKHLIPMERYYDNVSLVRVFCCFNVRQQRPFKNWISAKIKRATKFWSSLTSFLRFVSANFTEVIIADHELENQQDK